MIEDIVNLENRVQNLESLQTQLDDRLDIQRDKLTINVGDASVTLYNTGQIEFRGYSSTLKKDVLITLDQLIDLLTPEI